MIESGEGAVARIYAVTRGRRAKPRNTDLLDPLVEEIAEALFEIGGSAHRDVVIGYVATLRGVDAASSDVKSELLDAFELHCGCAHPDRHCALLHLPFGEGSHRWGLTPAGRQFVLSRQRFPRSSTG
jgi:hypothetical protein